MASRSTERRLFMISVAAELAEMHPQTLRMYEARGLIEPRRSPKGTRLYSRSDVDRLRTIQRMTVELGLNLAGVERVLELEGQLERTRARVAALEVEVERAQAQVVAEVERVRRSLRAEIVPYRASTALVRWTGVRDAPLARNRSPLPRSDGGVTPHRRS